MSARGAGLRAGRLVAGLLLVALGIFWLFDALGYVVRWQRVMAAALAVVGLALLVGARHRPHRGLVAVGVVLTVLLALGVTFRPLVSVAVSSASVGERTERPVTIGDLRPSYELGVGSLHLDLRELDLPASTTRVSASVGVGELVVRVPEDATVVVGARAGLGEVEVGDRARSGAGVELREELAGDERRLVVRAEVGIGSVEVER